MRKKFKDGTKKTEKSIIKSISPVGSIVATGKFIKNKIKKNKEDKKSRNPNPKTPKMMISDKPKKKTIKRYQKFKEPMGKKGTGKYTKPLGNLHKPGGAPSNRRS